MSGSLYPVAIDDVTSLPPPGPNTVTNAGTITHAVLHDNEIQAVQALETKLGTGSSTSTTSTVLRASSNGTSTWGKVVLTSDITGTLPVANGGTGTISSTGTGANVLANSPTLTTPAISSPTGLVKGDVGLGNVDNTSDTTKNAAAVALTNKDLTAVSNTFPNGVAVQEVRQLTSAVVTGTTLIPVDNTIPQNTEGDQYMSVSITPKSTTNTLVIQIVTMISSSIANSLIVTLFQDSTANALAVNSNTQSTSTGLTCVSLTHVMPAGTISATTFTVRCGQQSAGTMTFNGSGGAGLFGAITKSSIVITEYKS